MELAACLVPRTYPIEQLNLSKNKCRLIPSSRGSYNSYSVAILGTCHYAYPTSLGNLNSIKEAAKDNKGIFERNLTAKRALQENFASTNNTHYARMLTMQFLPTLQNEQHAYKCSAGRKSEAIFPSLMRLIMRMEK